MGMVDHVVANFHGDADRVYLTGLSYGGYGTWHLGAQFPDRFAAIAPSSSGMVTWTMHHH